MTPAKIFGAPAICGVDDVSLKSHPAPDLQGEALLDHGLKAWFQQMLAEPVPRRFLDLIERLDAAAGL